MYALSSSCCVCTQQVPQQWYPFNYKPYTLQLCILVRHMVMMIKVRVYLQIKPVSRAMSFKGTKRVRCVIGQSLTSKDTEPFKWCRAGSIYSAMS